MFSNKKHNHHLRLLHEKTGTICVGSPGKMMLVIYRDTKILGIFKTGKVHICTFCITVVRSHESTACVDT